MDLLELYYQQSDYVAKSVAVERYQDGEPIITVEWHPTWEPMQHVSRNFKGQILERHENLILVQWPPNAHVRLSELKDKYPMAFYGMNPTEWRGRRNIPQLKAFESSVLMVIKNHPLHS
jgi:hypothetical protein